jgi:hypothetical protein
MTTALDNPETVSMLLQHLRAGCDVDKSCTVSRVPRSSYYLRLATAETARADKSPDDWNENEQRCVVFSDAVELARAQSITSLELVIAQAARAEWRAAQVLLKKHESGSWNGTAKLEVSGANGGPIEVTAVPGPDMSNPEDARAIWEARADMGDAQAIKLLAALDD